MFKENFECVAVHRGDAWACVILESSEFFWKYRLLKYKCTIAFSVCIIARWCPWCILYQPECIWNNTRCVIETSLSDCHHDVTSSADYATVLFPELASRNQILQEMYFGSIYNATSMRFVSSCRVLLKKQGVNTDRFTMMSESSMDHSRSILESLETI